MVQSKRPHYTRARCRLYRLWQECGGIHICWGSPWPEDTGHCLWPHCAVDRICKGVQWWESTQVLWQIWYGQKECKALQGNDLWGHWSQSQDKLQRIHESGRDNCFHSEQTETGPVWWGCPEYNRCYICSWLGGINRAENDNYIWWGSQAVGEIRR